MEMVVWLGIASMVMVLGIISMTFKHQEKMRRQSSPAAGDAAQWEAKLRKMDQRIANLETILLERAERTGRQQEGVAK